METMPLVSVCMTTYNHERYLARAIESVLEQQTTFGVELVLGEDCSTDSTREICEAYAARYPERIRLVTSSENVGMRANYRRTFEACRGKYIAYLDGDDWWCDPLKLQRQADLLEADPGCGMCYTRADCWSETQQRVESRFPADEPHLTFDKLLLNSTIPNCTAVVRRELVAGYYTEVRPLAKRWPLDDYGMWLWCASHVRLAFLDRVTACYRVISESGSHFIDPWKILRYEEGILRLQLWFDRRFSSRSQRKNLLIQRFLVELEQLRPYGRRILFRGWLRCMVRHPRLLILGRSYHWLAERLRASRMTEKTDDNGR